MIVGSMNALARNQVSIIVIPNLISEAKKVFTGIYGVSAARNVSIRQGWHASGDI